MIAFSCFNLEMNIWDLQANEKYAISKKIQPKEYICFMDKILMDKIPLCKAYLEV